MARDMMDVFGLSDAIREKNEKAPKLGDTWTYPGLPGFGQAAFEVEAEPVRRTNWTWRQRISVERHADGSVTTVGRQFKIGVVGYDKKPVPTGLGVKTTFDVQRNERRYEVIAL